MPNKLPSCRWQVLSNLAFTEGITIELNSQRRGQLLDAWHYVGSSIRFTQSQWNRWYLS
jgi:hypothetical protein